MATSTWSPTALGTNAWTNPTNAYSSNDSRATATPGKSTDVAGIWKTYGITDPASPSTISKVEVGAEWAVDTDTSIFTLRVRASYDNGTNWTTYVDDTGEQTSESLVWYDVTDSRAWTWAELGNANFLVDVTASQGNSKTAVTCSLDHCPVRVTYATVSPCEVYAAEAILDYTIPPCEVYAAEAILNYNAPTEVYAAEAILDYEVPPTEVYAAEAILDYTVATEVYAAEAILDYEIAAADPTEVYAAEAILDYTAPAEVYTAEAILDYEVPPAEVYAAEAVLDYTVPAEVYAAEAVLDYEVPPCEVYAAETILDYIVPAEVYAGEAVLDYTVPTEIYAAEAVLDYDVAETTPCEVYAAEAVLDYNPPSTGGGTSPPFRWVYIPPLRKSVDELRERRARKKTIHITTTDGVAITDEGHADILRFAVPDRVYLDDNTWMEKQTTAFEGVRIDDSSAGRTYTSSSDGVRMLDYPSIFEVMPERPPIIRERSLEDAETVRFLARGARPSFLRKRLVRSKDPSLTRRIENDYAKELDKLFVSVKRDVAKLLGRRELSDDWDEIDAPDLMDKFDRVIEVTITIPGKGVVKKFTTRAYTQGGWRSSQFLNSLGIKAVFSVLPADRNALDILVTRDLSGLKGITDEMSKQIMSEITDGMLRGDPMDKVARAIDDRIDSIGRTRAEALARTETMKAYNEGSLVQYAKYGITEVEWLTAYANVCDECAALDGERFPIDAKPDCPLHPNCRCTLLPIVPEIPRD